MDHLIINDYHSAAVWMIEAPAHEARKIMPAGSGSGFIGEGGAPGVAVNRVGTVEGMPYQGYWEDFKSKRAGRPQCVR